MEQLGNLNSPMAIKLLPASVDPTDSADVSTSMVVANRGAVATRVNSGSDVGRAGDSYGWSGQRGTPRIYGTPVEDSESEDVSGGAGASAWEYVSALAGSVPIWRTAAVHYLMYAGMFMSGSGQLIDLYA